MTCKGTRTGCVRKVVRAASSFEKKTTRALNEQNEVLAALKECLNAPILNGGYNELVKEVGEIRFNQELLRSASSKIDNIDASINDPDHGIYVKVKNHSDWISKVNRTWYWVLGTVTTLTLTGAGKLLYDFFSHHFH